MSGKKINVFLFSIFLFFFYDCSSENLKVTDSPSSTGNVIKATGVYPFKNSDCIAYLTVNGMGGFTELHISKKGSDEVLTKVADITGITWASKNMLVFSVSPIYGKPGIFAYSCEKNQIKPMVKPSNFNKAYPDGSDYFELYKADPADHLIYYYYAPDVDETDFNKFREDKNLRILRSWP